jgi:hypothetical protein
MKARPSILIATLAVLAALAACARTGSLVNDPGKRKELIEALVSNPASRQEVIDRLIGPPNDRQVVFDRILKDEEATGHLVQKIMTEDRGKAIVVARVAADTAGARTFIRMLMLTGVMGDSMTQKQADMLGLGEPFAFGNQRRTMFDMKRVAAVVEEAAKKQEGRYPVCTDFVGLDACLARKLPQGSLSDVRLKDAWGNPILYHTDRDGTKYALISYAADGMDDGLGQVGPTQAYDCDIVFSNGDFIQWPGWIRKGDIR